MKQSTINYLMAGLVMLCLILSNLLSYRLGRLDAIAAVEVVEYLHCPARGGTVEAYDIDSDLCPDCGHFHLITITFKRIKNELLFSMPYMQK